MCVAAGIIACPLDRESFDVTRGLCTKKRQHGMMLEKTAQARLLQALEALLRSLGYIPKAAGVQKEADAVSPGE